MPRSTPRVTTARHIAVVIALLLLTMGAFLVEDRAVRQGLRYDDDLMAIDRERASLIEALERATTVPLPSADIQALANRWGALKERARALTVALGVPAADQQLTEAARAMELLLDELQRAAPEGAARKSLALSAGAALGEATAVLRSRLAEKRIGLLERHRGFTLFIFMLLTVEIAWLTLPPLRRVVRAESDAHEAQEQLAFLAMHDELTGLANRRALDKHLRLLASEADARFGIILCDLDGFKPINDVYGHDAGDAVLRAAARRLEHGLRPGDLAARLGGDEFVLVVAEARVPATLAAIAERLRGQLADPVGYGVHHLRFSASLGTALFPDDGATPHALLSAADAAMYEAKQAGGMGVRAYSQRLRERDEMRQEIVRELEQALAEGALSLVLQPQIELASGRHLGFEALTRWRSCTRGDVPASLFISIASEAGLLPQLTQWLLGEIARLNAGWRRRGLEPGCVSINVSGCGLLRDDVLDALVTASERAVLGGGRLGIEITEDVMFGRNAEAVLERLRVLHQRGMPIAIDDFGTGYASLSHLGRLPFDRLKIAGGFINQLGANANAAAVVCTIVELAHRLDRRAVATAVETDNQLGFLRAHHCDEAQGFRISAPLPPEAVGPYLERAALPQPAS